MKWGSIRGQGLPRTCHHPNSTQVYRCSLPLLPPPHGFTTWIFLPSCIGLWPCQQNVPQGALAAEVPSTDDKTEVQYLPRRRQQAGGPHLGPQPLTISSCIQQKQQFLSSEAQAFQRQALSHWDIISPARWPRRQMLRSIPSPVTLFPHILCYEQKAYSNARISLWPPQVHVGSPSYRTGVTSCYNKLCLLFQSQLPTTVLSYNLSLRLTTQPMSITTPIPRQSVSRICKPGHISWRSWNLSATESHVSDHCMKDLDLQHRWKMSFIKKYVATEIPVGWRWQKLKCLNYPRKWVYSPLVILSRVNG